MRELQVDYHYYENICICPHCGRLIAYDIDDCHDRWVDPDIKGYSHELYLICICGEEIIIFPRYN